MKRYFLLAIICLAFMSCENNAFYSEMFRTVKDPFNDVPKTNSLILDNSVYLEWKSDDAADSFELYRSADGDVLSFNLIYQGTDLTYTDTDLPENERYIYRLDKNRGKKHFTGTEYAYGYSSTARGDPYEDNDEEERATFLESDLSCNLPCVKYITNNEEKFDVDWFYIELPARRKADIVIRQKGLTTVSDGKDTDMYIQILGEERRPVQHNNANQVSNDSFETKIIKFKVFPQATNLFLGNSCSTVIGYEIEYSQYIKF